MNRAETRLLSVQLFVLGFLTLFLELALIRYLAGNIWNLGYFPNLVLIAVFIGMGLGFVFHHRFSDATSDRLFHGAAFLLALLVVFVTFLHPSLPGFNRWQGNFGGDLYFTDSPGHDDSWEGVAMFGVWFLSVMAIFALIAQRTAKLFREFAPLHAYTLDILGSCAGIVVFMFISWFQLPAYAWFSVLIGLFLVAQRATDSWTRWLPLFPLAVTAILVGYGDTRLLADPGSSDPVQVRWSPYQKIEYVDTPQRSHWIFANGVMHQAMFDIEHLQHTTRTVRYVEPYLERARHPELPRYKNVLVLGAGSGNDVAVALANGAEHVDAVEIDPGIAALGYDYHPAQGYHDSRVTLTVTDGRAFLAQARRKYDLIIFALTDSLVKVSPMSQLRLENYLFTEESVAKARRLLTEDGDLLFYNFYRRPWLKQKIEMMIHDATGAWPRQLYQDGDFAMLAAGKHNYSATPNSEATPGVTVAKDDWPFLYLEKPGIPPIYVKAMLTLFVVLAGLMFLVHRESRSVNAGGSVPTKLAFLFMGVAFLLLETKSVIQFALLFGTTWINNSLVFLAVLLLVLAANWTASGLRSVRLEWIYACLMASCLITLAFPLSGLLAVESAPLRFVLASLMTFSPIFFANLIFSLAFREQKVPEHVFGWNLIGATLGGVIEYTSLAIGYNALVLIVAAAYTLAFGALVVARAQSRAEAAAPAAAA